MRGALALSAAVDFPAEEVLERCRFAASKRAESMRIDCEILREMNGGGAGQLARGRGPA
jgi:hypothetical protein